MAKIFVVERKLDRLGSKKLSLIARMDGRRLHQNEGESENTNAEQ